MTNPFVYGKIARGGSFTDRESEQERITLNIQSHINTILISPRRWGKSSLVQKVANENLKIEKNVSFCFIDLFSIRTEQEFYESFAKEVIKATSSKWEEWIKAEKKYFKQLIPKFNIGIDPLNDFSISFDLEEVKHSADEILALPETVSKSKKIQIVVCIDEFQNFNFLEDPLGFQKKLRATWQHHQIATYCLYGSKRHVMMELFENKSMPFYKFGDIIFLEKIERKYWVKFIQANFIKTGKSINEEIAGSMADVMENHPYFVQQLAHVVWTNTKKNCTLTIINDSLEELMEQQTILFQRDIDNLTNPQLSLLKALTENLLQLSSANTLHKFNLGSSANVSRIKSALVNKEIIDITGQKIEFLDPLFKLWCKKMI